MVRRGLTALLFACAFSGCASVREFAADPGPEPSAPVVKSTPEQAYAAGVDYLQRGDYDAARREWDKCLAMAAPDSNARLDCMVARERLAYPAASEP